MSKSSHSASASRYANALFQLAKEAKVLDSISNDLDKIMELLLSDQDFASFIENPSIKNINKLSLLDMIADKLELSKLTKDFIGVATKKGRVSNIQDIIKSYKDLVSDFNGIKNAYVSTSKALSENQINSIKQKLREKFSSEFILHTEVDESLIAGLKIKIGSQMIDSTIKSKLNALKAKMKEVA
jgi:F-type H+-transporting ATPase subunit delta